MIGRQFRWYVLPADIDEIWRKVSNLGGVPLATSSESQVPVRLRRDQIVSGTMFVVVPNAMLKTVKLKQPRPTGLFVINTSDDPVVEVKVSPLSGRELASGRLYFVPNSSADQKPTPKASEVQQFASALLSWARSWTTQQDGRHLAPSAAEALHRGAIHLR